MRILFFLSLPFILLQLLPFGQSPPEPEEPKSPVKGWWMVSYFAVAPTQYSTAGKGIIKAESLGARSSLFKKAKEKEKEFSVLSWRWKISNVVHSAIETRKDRFDAAARVMVIFGTEDDLRPLWERATSRAEDRIHLGVPGACGPGLRPSRRK